MKTRFRERGDDQTYGLGLGQGRLQAEACSLEISSPTLGYRGAIGCSKFSEGLNWGVS